MCRRYSCLYSCLSPLEWIQKGFSWGDPSTVGYVRRVRLTFPGSGSQSPAAGADQTAMGQDPDAICDLAMAYWSGEGLGRDRNKAKALVAVLAAPSNGGGYRNAHLRLGEFYKEARETPKALHHLGIAEEKGVARASRHLAFMYHKGEGVRADEAKVQLHSGFTTGLHFGMWFEGLMHCFLARW